MSLDPSNLNRRQRRALAKKKAGTRARTGIGALLSVAMIAGTLGVTPGVSSAVTEADPSFRVNKADLEFILKQINISEHHAAGGDLLCEDPADDSGTCVPSPLLPWGLRTVDGSSNNLQPNQEHFGAAGEVFPRLLTPEFKDAGTLTFDPDGPEEHGGGPLVAGVDTSYDQTSGFVSDPEPRIISNLIVDQTAANPAALAAKAEVPNSTRSGDPENPLPTDNIFIPNESPDEALSAPFSSWFTLFGQFFDHGLDLVGKGGSGTVAVPLQPDDPLYDDTPGARTNFIMLTRATNQVGDDGVLGTADDEHEHTNRTTPFIDQNQTYTSHPSHQVFLREYKMEGGVPVPTGHLLDGAEGGLVTWTEVKAQARDLLGIELDDMDALNVPLVATDAYGHFIAGAKGLPRLVMPGAENSFVEGDLADPVDATDAMDAGVAFLDDIANGASPDIKDKPETPQLEEYDAAKLGAHYITGDGRGNENIGLTSVHHVFHSEHNRLADQIDAILQTGDAAFLAKWNATGPAGWGYGERVFQAARFVTEMEYQHLVFEEFARTIQPTIDAQPLNETAYHSDIDAAVKAEFAHVVYRFGHSMLTDTVAREGFGTDDLPLLDAFLNPAALTTAADGSKISIDQGVAAVIQGMAKQTGNGIDEFVVDTLRNKLLGLPLDLPAINIARARDTGVPSLQSARAAFYAATHDSALEPYENWEDFRLSMKHRGSIGNFIAAYGNHETLDAATTVAEKRAAGEALALNAAFMALPAAESGLNDVDFWMGGLAEQGMVFGGMLGTTFNYVFEDHMEDLQNGDRFYYLNRTQGMNLIHQLEANSFSELVMRNTDATLLPHNIFASPDNVFDLGQLTDPLPAKFSKMLDGTYRYDGPEHVVIHGTAAPEGIRGGDGDDSLWGHGGKDRLEGGIGNDSLVGGKGDDILTDLFGDDVIHGDDGNDAINAGAGADLLFGGFGKDFILHGNEITQSFAGGEDDFVRGGNANDIITGNEGDDWLEGNKGHDLVQGDNALTFQNDPNGGADVFHGGPGNDDHDAEGGDDIMLNNGIDRHAGMLGFDWVTHKNDPFAADADLDVSVFQPLNVTYMRSRFMAVEGLSGWDKPDVLRGTSGAADRAYPDSRGHQLTQDQLNRVRGLRQLLGGGTVPKYATPFMTVNEINNIILGGSNSDLIQGRSGDDYLDGDAQLDVYLEAPKANGDIERHEDMTTLQQRVFSGELSPKDITIVREVVTPDEQEDFIDTAYYEDVMANHVITNNNDGTWRVAHVDEDAGGVTSGTDTLRNIERVVFPDGSVDLVAGLNNGAAFGTIDFSTLTPKEDVPLSVTKAFDDPQGVREDTIVYTWYWGDDEGEWTASVNGVGTTFTPGDAEAGKPLRVIATFLDGTGAQETITSMPTFPVENVNDVPTGLVVSNTSPVVGDVVTPTGLVDGDGTHNDDGDVTVNFRYQWQSGNDGTWANIAGATEEALTVIEALHGKQLRVIVSYTDNLGGPERVESAPTSRVGFPNAPATGTVTISTSTPVEGQTLTVTSTHADTDGITADTVVYTWEAQTANATWTPVATGTTFEPTSAEAGSRLRVVVSFTDGNGVIETLTSTETEAVEAAATTDPGTGNPGTGNPGTGDPGTGDPGTGDPGTGDPGTGDPGTPTAPVFTDVAGTTHATSIDKIVAAGITSGFPDGTFRPTTQVTRGQMATFLATALELPAATGTSRFTDVAGTTHAASIESIVAAGIAGGFGDGTFRPDAPVTRGQMATFLKQAFDLPAGEAGKFPDVAGTPHEAAINAVASAGIAGGFADGTYRPNAPVNRGQMATFLVKALGL